jgi:hypothetical protein
MFITSLYTMPGIYRIMNNKERMVDRPRVTKVRVVSQRNDNALGRDGAQKQIVIAPMILQIVIYDSVNRIDNTILIIMQCYMHIRAIIFGEVKER